MELPIYGLSRVGTVRPDIDVFADLPPDTIYTRTLDEKSYELTDHLGNVRAVLGDVKLSDTAGSGVENFRADIAAYTHPYPFGSSQPRRTYQASEYRYGFNGMEEDPEVAGEENHFTTYFRQYDPRLGRWWSVDPLEHQYSEFSPYTAVGDNPIVYTDSDGDKIKVYPAKASSEFTPDGGYVGILLKVTDKGEITALMNRFHNVILNSYGGNVRLSTPRGDPETGGFEYGIEQLEIRGKNGRFQKYLSMSDEDREAAIAGMSEDQQRGLEDLITSLDEDELTEFSVIGDLESSTIILDDYDYELLVDDRTYIYGVMDLTDFEGLLKATNRKLPGEFKLGALSAWIHVLWEQRRARTVRNYWEAHDPALSEEGRVGNYMPLLFRYKKERVYMLEGGRQTWDGLYEVVIRSNEKYYLYSFTIEAGNIVDASMMQVTLENSEDRPSGTDINSTDNGVPIDANDFENVRARGTMEGQGGPPSDGRQP